MDKRPQPMLDLEFFLGALDPMTFILIQSDKIIGLDQFYKKSIKVKKETGSTHMNPKLSSTAYAPTFSN